MGDVNVNGIYFQKMLDVTFGSATQRAMPVSVWLFKLSTYLIHYLLV